MDKNVIIEKNASCCYIHDLEMLENELDTIVPETFFEKHVDDIWELSCHLLYELYDENANEYFNYEWILEEMKELVYEQLGHLIKGEIYEQDIMCELDTLLEESCRLFMSGVHGIEEEEYDKENEYTEYNEYTENNEYTEKDCDCDSQQLIVDDNKELEKHLVIKNKIEYLRSIPQPVQRTPEWYLFRWNLITASNAWKALGTQCSINQLIYEKCQPLKCFDDQEKKAVNTNTTLHWGQKYESLSVMLYEYMYDSKVCDFGCIRHPRYSFLGASPDGIIIESNTNKYGRMLEIKNVVNREITGIPKSEYMIQMQLQMEVCDLDECDFLETKFVEYDYASFINDTQSTWKGTIMHFDKGGIPHYEYMPLRICKNNDPCELSLWEEETIQQIQNTDPMVHFVKYIYWKLEKMSCVLVHRDKQWFQYHVGQLERVWAIIEKERETGFEHRAPNRKIKKEAALSTDNETCFLQFLAK